MMQSLRILDTVVETYSIVHYEQTNFMNRMHGGDMLFLLVETGMLSAIKVSRGTTLLASIDDVVFKKAVRLGDIIKVKAEVVYVGNTSAEVEIRAFDKGEEVVSAYATYVKVDDLLRPIPINVKVEGINEEEIKKVEEAKKRREIRISRIKDRQKMRFYVEDPTEGLRFRITTSIYVSPSLTYDGKIMSGGKLLKLMDDIGGVILLNYIGYDNKPDSGGVVTVAVKGLSFYSPIRINDIIHIRAGIVYVGNTSADVMINVIREDLNGFKEHVATAYFTYVRVNDQGKPIKMPEYRPETGKEKSLYQEALARRGLAK